MNPVLLWFLVFVIATIVFRLIPAVLDTNVATLTEQVNALQAKVGTLTESGR